MVERCLLLPTILTPGRRLTKVRRTKVRSNRSLTEVRWKKVSKQRATQARRINVPSQRQTKARLTTTTKTKMFFKKTHAGLDHPILPVDSGHPKALTPSQLQKIQKYVKALENQNLSNMYLSGRLARSTTSEQKTKWWLDDEDEEKPGVTPADDHLEKRPVKTHIYSREEMEALAEEKLRYVVDIDDKKISWILLNRPWPSNQVFCWQRIMQNRRKIPFHSDCSNQPYPTATKIW
jgi:hypothetical protein